MLRSRSTTISLASLLLLASFGFVWSTAAALPAAGIPAQLTDEEFWKLNTDLSEPGGYFRSDNFVSNEDGFQFVIPDLKTGTKPGGVYLGVGPDQNFTYIVALQPEIAFI